MPRLNRDLWFVYASLLLFALGMGAYSTILPAYVRSLGASPVDLGLLGTIGMAFSTLAALPGGYWADRYDRRTLMILGWAMCIPVPLIFAFAPSWPLMIPGYFLFYFSMFSNTAMQAYIAHKADPDNVSFTFTFVFSSFSVGSIIAPTLGGWLSQTVGIKAVFGVAFLFYLLSTLAIFFMTPDKPQRIVKHKRASLKSALTPELLRFTLIFTLVMFITNIPLAFVTPYMQDVANYDLLRIGMLGSLTALGGVILAPLLGRLGDRLGTFTAVGFALLMLSFAYGLQLSVHVLPLYILAFLIRGGAGSINSLMLSQIGKLARADVAGMTFALYNLATSIGATFAPYAAGQLYAGSPRAPFIATSIATLLLAAVFLSRSRLRERTVKRQAG